jgi:hypothetical protein
MAARYLKIGGQLVALGGGGGGNATVPIDALIQPPQAFVDNIGFFAAIIRDNNGHPLTPPNRANIEALDPVLVLSYAQGVTRDGGYGDPPTIDLSGAKLNQATVNSILAELSTYWAANYLSGGTLNISGGTNAAPTGQGLTDKAALISLGWTVTTN